MKFSLTVSTNGVSTRVCHNWNNFCLFWFRLGCAWLWLVEEFPPKCRWLSLFVVATRFSLKTMCTITAKQHNCWFLVHKTNIQNVPAGFALFTVVETSRFIGWIVNTFFASTCWTIHISNSLLSFVLHTQFLFSLFLVDWNRAITYNCLLGTKFIFFLAKKKHFLSVFVVFTCSCNTLWTSKQAPHFPQP